MQSSEAKYHAHVEVGLSWQNLQDLLAVWNDISSTFKSTPIPTNSDASQFFLSICVFISC